ncbi:MAG: Crp/Fnr family transcriptional regulator [Silvibacterium sp.]
MPPEGANLLLKALSPESRNRLLSNATMVTLPLKAVLYEPEEQPRYGYFLTSGVASVVASVEEGGTAEVGMIGLEGIAGGVQLLGPAPVPTQCFMQAAGAAVRIPFIELRKAYRESDEIQERILEYVQTQALGASQISGCHRLHDAEARLARWLLMVRDRIQSDSLGLTQEFLAQMLGSRRTTVTLVAGTLQKGGLIEYTRGRVHIVNAENLEKAACSCYPILRDLARNLYIHSIRNGHE